MNILVDLHAHTLASSHAYSTVREYIQEACSKQLKLIAITDHGPDLLDSPHEWHFYNIRSIPKYVNGVRVLKGIEANIREDGTIDCTDSMKKNVDFVMAGFHPPIYKQCEDRDKNTDVLLEVLNRGNVSIITHPGNPQYPIHPEVIAKAAMQNKVALEVNNASLRARPGSLDNCLKIIEAVKQAGGYVSIGSDAHYCSQIGDFPHALSILESIEFPAQRIINYSVKNTLSFLDVPE